MSKQKAPRPSVKRAAFLAAYATTGNVTAAAKLSKVSRQQHYEWLRDLDYADAFAAAHAEACELLENEARRRAMQGTLKPVFYKGDKCGVIREYSDTLLIFLMKGAMPERYRDNAKIEHTGPGGGPLAHRVDLSNLSDEQLEQLEALARAAAETKS